MLIRYAARFLMLYGLLFCGLPVLGVFAYLMLCVRMATRLPSPPYFPFFFIFAAYGAVLLFAVSIVFRQWSGMHSIAAVGLLFVGMPWLIVQSIVVRKSWSQSWYNRVAIVSGACFPVAIAALVLFAFAWDATAT